MAQQQNGADQRSWWRKVFGRSLLKAVVGDFFDSKRNTASIIGIMLVGTLCYVVLFRDKYEYMAVVINLAFAVSGFYFASRVGPRDDADDEGK
jgi:Na+/pantothenate symporter